MAQVFAQIEQALAAGDIRRAEALCFPALDQFPDLSALYFHAGNIFFRSERPAMAAMCYRRAWELEPQPVMLSNLGAALRQLNLTEAARETLLKSLEYDENNAATLTNIAASYVNEGNPWPGIIAAAKALELRPDYARAQWNMGLLYLEAGEFAKGWKNYRAGLGAERLIRCYTDDPANKEPPMLDSQLAGQYRKTGKKVIVWGEQGIGDELMMGSILNDLSKDFEVIFDCHPRLESIFRRAWPGMKIYPTRKSDWIDWPVEDGVVADFKCGLGDLGGIYRNTREQFDAAWQRRGPFYGPISEERDSYRVMLEALAEGRRIVGLAIRGGVIKTNRGYRSISLEDLDPLLSQKGLMFVSFDYEDVRAQTEEINKRYGEGTIWNFPAITNHWDYDHTLSLVHATDALVTVCQSVFHLSASSGHKTLCLVPSKPAWRYGLTDSVPYWYPGGHARLYRQEGNDWAPAVQNLIGGLEKCLVR